MPQSKIVAALSGALAMAIVALLCTTLAPAPRHDHAQQSRAQQGHAAPVERLEISNASPDLFDVEDMIFGKAYAQSATDEWKGTPQRIAAFHGSLSSEAVIISAVSGKALCIKSLSMGTSASGTLTLYDGSGSTVADQFDLVATHDPVTIDQRHLGKGIILTRGNGLYGQLAGATVTISARVEED